MKLKERLLSSLKNESSKHTVENIKKNYRHTKNLLAHSTYIDKKVVLHILNKFSMVMEAYSTRMTISREKISINTNRAW
jgi:hypothetical protein